MPDWKLSERLLAGKGLAFARKGNLPGGGFQPSFRIGGRFRYGHSEAGQSAVSQTAEFWRVPLATKPASARTATMPKITVRVRMVFTAKLDNSEVAV